MDLMSYSFFNFVTNFLVATERKCHICDISVLNNKLTFINAVKNVVVLTYDISPTMFLQLG